MNDIIEIAASLAECCIFVRLCNGFLGFKKGNLKWLKSSVLFILLFFDTVFLTDFVDFQNISSFVIFFLIFCYSFIFLKGKLWEKMLISILPAIIEIPINMIVINTLSMLSDGDKSIVMPGGKMRFCGLVISKIIFFILCEVIIKIKNKQAYVLNKFQQIIQLSCFLISFVISTLLWNFSREQNETYPMFAIIFLLILSLNILLYIFMSKMQKDNVTTEEFNLLKASLSAQEKLAVEVY